MKGNKRAKKYAQKVTDIHVGEFHVYTSCNMHKSRREV